LFGLFFSLLWHFVWGIGLVPVLSSGHYEKIRGRAIYAGAFLNPSDFFPSPPQATGQKNAFGIPGGPEAVPRSALEKIEGGAPKPEILLAGVRQVGAGGNRGPVIERHAPEERAGGEGSLSFGMSDYSRYLYQADFSDLRRAAGRDALSRAIVFEVLLDNEGRVVRMKKISGSGDPSLDLFIQSKIDNAVFKPDVAPRGRRFTVSFSLR
jgi:hypothetical protein